MEERRFREAFWVQIDASGYPRQIANRKMSEEFATGFAIDTEAIQRVEEIRARIEAPNMLTLWLLSKGQFQRITISGSFRVWWGSRDWVKPMPKNRAPRIADDHLIAPVALAILIMRERGDTSSKSVAEEVMRHMKSAIGLTGKKVGYIAREVLGLHTARKGATGRYCIIVSDEDCARLGRIGRGEASDEP